MATKTDAKKKSKDKSKKEKEKEKEKSPTKERKKKTPTEEKGREKRRAKDPVEQPPAPAPVEPIAYDPDAIQLFRRYDQSRTGFLTRLDFLSLLRDYAQPPIGSQTARHRQETMRAPLSLTDASGIPLGYARAEKNSEFEAGQLFERYDKDHTGTLTMDKFQVFFADFRPQLRVFAEDLSYAASHPPPPPQPEPVAVPQNIETSKELERQVSPQPRPPSPRPAPVDVPSQYRVALWELRKICKEELVQQRELVKDKLAKLKEVLSDADTGQSSHSDPLQLWSDGRDRHRSRSSWQENQLNDQYEAMESDLERMERILRIVRRQLRKRADLSITEMEQFLIQSTSLLQDARDLAMRVYDHDEFQTRAPHSSNPRRIEDKGASKAHPISPNPKNRDPQASPHGESHEKAKDNIPEAKDKKAEAPVPSRQTVSELERMLSVKDQIIYQLLQQRTVLRREKASMESYVHELTEVSTLEMKKWAQLTDEMQAEIEHLRAQLHRH
ncbi:hypothetical protein Poli38472_012694 [Pythium oligandrum]|uniref:EF-hand domain-containing protein n=1 Tax=Pythium oligandrum TaxID=41045 RepID=A0A8K1CEF2_PYTOL|nr:hypothetical protein Poli38472_012694 [Pythium oligandrum]|eukprot:TMW61503.1 hypothetical protein Poli38472_012694 [Pythium oligandrum]